MNKPLLLGALSAAPFTLRRSGIRWLRPDGSLCRAHEVIGYCQLTVQAGNVLGARRLPFGAERTLQAALAPRVAGRLRLPPDAVGGGHLDVLGVRDWDPDEVVAHIDPGPGADETGTGVRLLLLAGRRMAWAVDVDIGLLPGWNSLARAWWSETGAEAGARAINLATLGVCDATGFIRGDQSGFVEMFETARMGAHLAHATEHPLVPCALHVLEQHCRSASQSQAILDDISAAVATATVTPTAEDLTFLGAPATQLTQTPLRESYDILTPQGLKRQKPPEVILMSVISEPSSLLRRRTLGYHLHIHDHNRRAAGPVVQAWLASAFEPVRRNLDDTRRDLTRLADTLAAETGARLLVVNRMSTSGRETISTYAPFDPPLDHTLVTVAAKMTNLMLDDLAEQGRIAVVDLDALAADLGGAAHLPDGVHQGGRLQQALREEVLRLAAATVETPRV